MPEPDRRARLHQEADALLKRWPDPLERPALFGTPLAVKDVMHTRGWVTRAGSKVDPTAFAADEAVVVTRLRDAGAMVVGKTVTAEFASKAPGETRNPHDHARTPGGSSSGSAAAVAIGTADLATGTQTIGSVIRPAAFCGIVGMKPTHGRASIEGIVAHSPSFDTPGVFAREVEAVRAAAMVMWDRWQASGPAARGRLVVAGGEYLEPGRAQWPARRSETLWTLLRAQGWSVDEHDLLPDLPAVRAHNLVINRYELPRCTRLGSTPTGRTTGTRQCRRSTKVARSPAPRTTRHSTHLRAFRTEMDRRVAALDAAAVITPAAPGPAPLGIETTGDPAMAMPWTYGGLPAIALPAGRSPEGLPLGVQLVGRRGADEALVALAADLEQAFAGLAG